MLGKNRMASGREEALKHVLLGLAAAKRAVFCWQCFSDLGSFLLDYLHCLCQCVGNLVGTTWSLL